MTPDRLLQHFARISEAPDAIPRLRRFILDLAVRGKLVPQNSDDEPAAELLERIEAAKERLAKNGEMPKAKPLSPIKEDELLFDIPQNWTWTRLCKVTRYIQRGKSPKYASSDGPPVISQKCIQWDGLHLEWAKAITSASIDSYEPIRFLRDGDLLWNSTGTGTIGRVIRVDNPRDQLVCDSHVTVVRCLLVNERFVQNWLRSFFVYGTIETRAAGATNQVELTAAIANNQTIPIPPLAEQHRIVAKVDELMALCDELEAAQAKREKRRDRLVAATLHGLNNGDTAAESGSWMSFTESARFYFNHLPRLTTRPEHIKQLRQTILNLAVRGKLVPQDPNDDPASTLIERIHKHRYGLIEEKKLRSTKPNSLSIVRRDELQIPENWAWGKFEEIVFVTKLAGFEFTNYFELEKTGEVPVVRAQNVRPWKMDKSNLLFINSKTSEVLNRSALAKHCLLVTFIGAGIGDVALFEENERWHLAPNVAKVELHEGCENELCLNFLLMFLNSPFGRLEIFKHVKATAQPSISMATIRDIDIPIPPNAEQHRIVAKVAELMALCDALEANLTSTASTQRRFLEAILGGALKEKSLQTDIRFG